MESHLGALGLSGKVCTISFLLLGSDDTLLLVESDDLMVHNLDGQEFLLQQFLLLDEEGLSLADGAGDLLTCPLRLLLQVDLGIIALFDLLLEPHLEQLGIAELLLGEGEVALGL